jgi:hypothetical protein
VFSIRQFSGFGLIDIAPHPRFPSFIGTNQRVLGLMKVFGRVLVLRGIAASDMPARQAQPQVNPGVAGLDAVFANVFIATPDLDLIQMGALISHVSSNRSRPSQVTTVM